jgi:hypothetical protein
MTVDEVSSLFRKGEGRLFLDKLKVRDKNGNLHEGSGSFSIATPKFNIDASISKFGQFNLADIRGVIHRKNFWDIHGVAEHDLKFRCPKVPPVHSMSGSFRRSLWNFEIDVFELVHEMAPEPFRQEWMRIHGVLPNYSLTFADQSTTITTENAFWGKRTSSKVDFFQAETKTFRFGFQQCDSDVHVFFDSKSPWRSCSPSRYMREWNSLLKALAFLTGVEALPFHQRICPGDCWIERFHPLRIPAKTSYTPFSPRLSFADKDQTSALALMAEFLCDSPIANDVAAAMYLVRAVGSKSLNLTTLVHAVVFEGLVDVLF